MRPTWGRGGGAGLVFECNKHAPFHVKRAAEAEGRASHAVEGEMLRIAHMPHSLATDTISITTWLIKIRAVG